MTTTTDKTADLLRTLADEASDWAGTHQHAASTEHGLERAAQWSRRAARRVERDPRRHLAYEASRQLRRRPWMVPLTIVAVSAVTIALTTAIERRRRRDGQDEPID